MLEVGHAIPPNRYQLVAAYQVVLIVDRDRCTQQVLDNSYSNTPADGLYGVNDFRTGQFILEYVGLLTESDDTYSATETLLSLRSFGQEEAIEIILHMYLTRSQPRWLPISTGVLADAGERTTLAADYIPEEALDNITTVIADPERREAFLMALGRRVDPDRSTKTGIRGEEHVVNEAMAELTSLGRPDLAIAVTHVSLVSDQLGYDITAPRTDNTKRRIEVKTTTTDVTQDCEIHLSRNEYETSRQASWSLVVCHIDSTDTVRIVGWCTRATLEPHCPTDPSPRSRWQQVRIAIPTNDLMPGLPPAI